MDKTMKNRNQMTTYEVMQANVDATDRRNAETRASVRQAEREQNCVGHVGSDNDPKVCAHCGCHIDGLR